MQTIQLVTTKHGVGRLVKVDEDRAVAVIEMDYMYLVEFPLEDDRG